MNTEYSVATKNIVYEQRKRILTKNVVLEQRIFII